MNTREQESELAIRAKAGDPDAYATLLDAHRGVITKWIRRYAGGFAEREHAEDLASEGIRAFAIALSKFDPSRGNRLVTVLRFAVRRYVLEYLQRVTRLHSDGRCEYPLDTACYVDSSTNRTRTFFDYASPVTRAMGARVGVPQIDATWDASVLQNAGFGGPDTPPSGELVSALRAALETLSPQIRHVVQLRYFHKWGVEKIMAEGYAVPVNRSRVARDLARGLQKLRDRLASSSGSTSGPSPESP